MAFSVQFCKNSQFYTDSCSCNITLFWKVHVSLLILWSTEARVFDENAPNGWRAAHTRRRAKLPMYMPAQKWEFPSLSQQTFRSRWMQVSLVAVTNFVVTLVTLPRLINFRIIIIIIIYYYWPTFDCVGGEKRQIPRLEWIVVGEFWRSALRLWFASQRRIVHLQSLCNIYYTVIQQKTAQFFALCRHICYKC